MPRKFTDEEGNEIEVKTDEEIAADIEAARLEAIEEYKKNNPPAETPAKTQEEGAVDPIEELKKTVEGLQTTLRAKEIKDLARTYAPGDTAKQAEFEKGFSRLSGYENTPEGMLEQAEAAAKIAGIDVSSVSVADVAGTGSGRNIDSKASVAKSEADAVIQKALGITEEDVKKFAPAADSNQTN